MDMHRYPALAALLAVVLMLVFVAGQASARTPPAKTPSSKTAPAPDKAAPGQVPSDFTMTYSHGPAQANMGGTRRVTLKADGSYLVERQPRNPRTPNDWQVKAQGRLKPHKLAEVYQAVKKHGFWALKRQHSNPLVMDGCVAFISVRADGRSHWVSMSNTHVAQVDAIVSTLLRALPKSHRKF